MAAGSLVAADVHAALARAGPTAEAAGDSATLVTGPRSDDRFTASMHKKFLLRLLDILPTQYSSLDTNRLTLLYFCVSGLDVLGALDAVDADRIIRWIYSLQVLPPTDAAGEVPPDRCAGFRGSGYLGSPFDAEGSPSSSGYDGGHLAMTYTALAVLTILEDDLSRVHRERTLAFVRSLQDEGSGHFWAYRGGEADMRFLYCAAAICTFLRDEEWIGIDVELATQYVARSQCYDGGIGLGPGQESHGGSTYTAVGALALMGTLDALPRRAELVQWCVERQVGGFQGRPNKDEDTCYSFWIGASLDLLGAPHLTDANALCDFACACQHPAYGGIAKLVGNPPDVLHTYFAICGMSLAGRPGLRELHTPLGITVRAARAAGLVSAEDACPPCDP